MCTAIFFRLNCYILSSVTTSYMLLFELIKFVSTLDFILGKTYLTCYYYIAIIYFFLTEIIVSKPMFNSY